MTNLPATKDDTAALAIPSTNEWGDVDSGWSGATDPTAAPIVPLLTFNAKLNGGLHDELTGDHYGVGDTLRAVWLAWSESRAYWKDDFGTGDKTPTCRSATMIAPDEASTDKQSVLCATCPMSQWAADGKPPRCGVRISVMLYLPEQERITRTAFGGLSMKHVQRYLGGFSTRLPQRPPMAFITEISVAQESTSNGDFLVPHFRIAGDVSREEAAPLIVLRDELRKQWEALAAEDLANSTAPNSGSDPFPAAPRADDIVYEDDEEPF